jgi:hypothetical protein
MEKRRKWRREGDGKGKEMEKGRRWKREGDVERKEMEKGRERDGEKKE